MKIHRLEPPQKTFFFERKDGSVFPTDERDAWRIINGRNQTYIVGDKPKLIGVSDGKLFHQAVMEAHEMFEKDPEGAKQRIKDGQQEEQDFARGKIEMPRDFDKIDNTGNPTKL
jgi:hypothetical protein